MATPTTLPVPSTDPNDLLFNAEKLDEAVNSAASTYTDRLGVSRQTIAGAVATIKAFTDRGAWAPATAYAVKDLVQESGTWYVSVEAHTSSALFATDKATKWRVYQGVLDADLSVADYTALRAYVGDSTRIYVTGYLVTAAPSGIAGMFVRDDADTTTADDSGITIVDSLGRRWKRQFDGAISAFWYGATAGTSTDQSTYCHAAFDAAKLLGIGVVQADGELYFTSDLVLRNGVWFSGTSRSALVLRMDGCTVTNEVLSNSNPSCRNTGLRATIESVNGTELVGLDLKGVQYSDFDVKISGFSSASSIGLRCTSVLDPGAGAYRYTTNNTFHDIEVTGCYKGVHLTKNPLDGATFGSNFNLFLQGYINGYTSIGVHLEYGEAVSFYGTRCTTSIGAGSIGWKIQDSICRLIGCTADGSFGGTVPGTLDAWGFPHGRDGDLTTTGFYFTAGASGAVVISSGGDACYKRFDFDSQTTLDNIQIMGRVSYNWFPDLMVKQLTALSGAAATACQTLHNRVAGSSTVLAQYKNGSSVNNGLLRMLSNGAIEFGSGDSDTKLLAGNAVAWRAAATTLAWQPEGDNTQSLGTSTKRASVVYAGTGTINTSDEREKQQVRTLSDAERAVAVRVKGLIRAFKFNDAVEKKGDGARVHFGVIAQDVIAAFQAEGLDPFAYAMVCYDEWPDTYEPGDDGEPVLVTPAGSRYGIRYEELLAFVLGAM